MPEVTFPVTIADGVPVVVAPEEIDITNAGLLRAALLGADATGSHLLVVDMSRTHFCDSAGLNVLVRAHKRAEAEGSQVRLVISSDQVLRIFEVTGIDSMFPAFASLPEALTPSLAAVAAPSAG